MRDRGRRVQLRRRRVQAPRGVFPCRLPHPVLARWVTRCAGDHARREARVRNTAPGVGGLVGAATPGALPPASDCYYVARCRCAPFLPANIIRAAFLQECSNALAVILCVYSNILEFAFE